MRRARIQVRPNIGGRGQKTETSSGKKENVQDKNDSEKKSSNESTETKSASTTDTSLCSRKITDEQKDSAETKQSQPVEDSDVVIKSAELSSTKPAGTDTTPGVENGDKEKTGGTKLVTPAFKRGRFVKPRPNINIEAARKRSRLSSLSGASDTDDDITAKRVPPPLPTTTVPPAPGTVVQPPPIQRLATLASPPHVNAVEPPGIITENKAATEKKAVHTDSVDGAVVHNVRPEVKATSKPKMEFRKKVVASHVKREVRKTVALTEPVDRAKMRISDLIYNNPTTNRMKSSVEEERRRRERERRQTEEEGGSVIGSPERGSVPGSPDRQSVAEEDPTQEPETGNQTPDGASQMEGENDDENDGDDGTEEAALAPQVTIGPDGEIILNEKSLVVDNPDPDRSTIEEEGEIVEEYGNAPYNPSMYYGRTAKTKSWGWRETKKFYLALSVIGCDFSMMSTLFPQRSRTDLKKKFKKEEKVNRFLVDKSLKEKKTYDLAIFDELSSSEDEETKKQRKKEQRVRRRQEVLEQKRQEVEQRRIERVKVAQERKDGKNRKKKPGSSRLVMYDESSTDTEDEGEGRHQTENIPPPVIIVTPQGGGTEEAGGQGKNNSVAGFTCDICNKVLKTKSGLKGHLKRHFNTQASMDTGMDTANNADVNKQSVTLGNSEEEGVDKSPRQTSVLKKVSRKRRKKTDDNNIKPVHQQVVATTSSATPEILNGGIDQDGLNISSNPCGIDSNTDFQAPVPAARVQIQESQPHPIQGIETDNQHLEENATTTVAEILNRNNDNREDISISSSFMSGATHTTGSVTTTSPSVQIQQTMIQGGEIANGKYLEAPTTNSIACISSSTISSNKGHERIAPVINRPASIQSPPGSEIVFVYSDNQTSGTKQGEKVVHMYMVSPPPCNVTMANSLPDSSHGVTLSNIVPCNLTPSVLMSDSSYQSHYVNASNVNHTLSVQDINTPDVVHVCIDDYDDKNSSIGNTSEPVQIIGYAPDVVIQDVSEQSQNKEQNGTTFSSQESEVYYLQGSTSNSDVGEGLFVQANDESNLIVNSETGTDTQSTGAHVVSITPVFKTPASQSDVSEAVPSTSPAICLQQFTNNRDNECLMEQPVNNRDNECLMEQPVNTQSLEQPSVYIVSDSEASTMTFIQHESVTLEGQSTTETGSGTQLVTLQDPSEVVTLSGNCVTVISDESVVKDGVPVCNEKESKTGNQTVDMSEKEGDCSGDDCEK